MKRPKALALFYRTLAGLLAAGVPVTGAVAQAGALLPGAAGLAGRIAVGDTLAQALASAPEVFPITHRRLIAAAEQGGRIETALQQLAALAEDVARMRSKVLGGLVLPGMIFHFAALIAPVPAFFRGGSLTDYLLSALGPIASGWAVVLGGAQLLSKLPAARRDGVISKLPWFSQLWRELDLWWLASGMHLLLNAGVGTIAALRECAGQCRSATLAAALREAADVAELRGQPVSVGLEAAGVLPPDLLAQWKIGERSGCLDQALARVAADYGGRVEARWRTLAEWAPRIVYGIVVLFMIAQIFALAGAAFLR